MGSVESGGPQEWAQRTGRRRGRGRGRPKGGANTRGRGAGGADGGSEVRIERSAQAHLERHSSSVENLRRLLRRRVARWRGVEDADRTGAETRAHEPRDAACREASTWRPSEAGAPEAPKAELHEAHEESSDEAAVERVLARLQRYGLLDDRAYAAGVVRRRRARGGSTRAIAAHLREKGVPDEIAREALDAEAGGPGEGTEFTAACRYARRRRLGPFRASDTLRTERHERDLAALGRAGFGYEIALRVIDAPDRNALLEMLDPQSGG